MGLCWVWPLKLRKSIWIIMKLHKIRTRFKVTIVLCPSLLKISLWRSEKGHRATWRGKYQQRNQFAAIFNQSDPEWSRPRGRVSQDHSGSLILGVRIVCGTEFRPRVTQDRSGSPRSGGSDRSWNRAQGNSQQQLLYHGDIAPCVNSAAIFDAPTPCCGVNYRCRAAPSVLV